MELIELMFFCKRKVGLYLFFLCYGWIIRFGFFFRLCLLLMKWIVFDFVWIIKFLVVLIEFLN